MLPIHCGGGLPRMWRMSPSRISTLSRRAITRVLALWLCVVVAGVWAPMVRADMAARSVEQLCSGHGAPQWAPSPAAHGAHADAAALHHLIDCPLCLPVLAPGPMALTAAVQQLPRQSHLALDQAPIQHLASHWPPARGPPTSTHKF